MSDTNVIEAFSTARFFQNIREGKLMAVKCKKCGRLALPPRPVCPDCGGQDFDWVELSGKGKIATFTNIAVAPTFMVEKGHGRNNPYFAVIVEFEEGQRLSGYLAGASGIKPEELKIGTPVVLDFALSAKETDPLPTLVFQLA